MADTDTEAGWASISWADARVLLGMSEEKMNELEGLGWRPVDLLHATADGLTELHLAGLTRARLNAFVARLKAGGNEKMPSDYDVYKQAVSAIRVFLGEQKDLLRFIYDIEMNVKSGSCLGGIRVRVAINRMDGDAKKWLLMKEKRGERFEETDDGWVEMKKEMNDLWMYVDEEQDALDSLAEMEWDPSSMDGSVFVVRFLALLLAGGVTDEATQVKILKTKVGIKARKYLKQKNPAATWAETVKALKEFEVSVKKKKQPERLAVIDDPKYKPPVQCFNCKGFGHYSSRCPKKRDTSQEDKKKNAGHPRGGRDCHRCGEAGHMAFECPAPAPKPRTDQSNKDVDQTKQQGKYVATECSDLAGHETAKDLVTLQADIQPRIWVKLAGVWLEALVDSGASVSVVDTVAITGIQGVQRGRGDGKILKMADGSEFAMEGEAIADIMIGNVSVQWSFQISPKRIPAAVVIGWDLMRQLDLQMFPKEGRVRVFGEVGWSSVKMIGQSVEQQYSLIRSK